MFAISAHCWLIFKIAGSEAVLRSFSYVYPLKIWWGHFSLWRKAVNFCEFIFTIHRQTEKYVEMISTSHSSGKLKHYNLALQLMIFYIFIHIPFSANKFNFHFKGRSSIIILQINNVNFQAKQFIIFQKFWWNSVQPI